MGRCALIHNPQTQTPKPPNGGLRIKWIGFAKICVICVLKNGLPSFLFLFLKIFLYFNYWNFYVIITMTNEFSDLSVPCYLQSEN